MFSRSNAIGRILVPIVLSRRQTASGIGSSVHHARRSKRMCNTYLLRSVSHSHTSDEKIQALVQRLSTLENSVRTTQHVPNIAIQDIHGSPPDAVMSSDRPMKRKRTESLVNSTSPTTVPEVDTTQQSATEARSLISKELTTNGFLTGHQRSVLETAMNFVDHLSHAPVPPITDRSTFNKNMYSSVDLSKGEILKVILGSMFIHRNHSVCN